MSRVASIDIGTNSALLLIADAENPGKIVPLFEQERIIRLGEDVDRNGVLLESAMKRALDTLRQYQEVCKKWQVESVFLTATSAVRDARNRLELFDRVATEVGLEMEILSGRTEAARTHFGALSNKMSASDEVLTIDIGGGSTEFALGNKLAIKHSVSLAIGSVRLTERFIRHDPPYATELEQVIAAVQTAISPLSQWQKSPPDFMVASAGTATTLAALLLKLTPYDPAQVDGMPLNFAQVDRLVTDFKNKNVQEIASLPGIARQRAPVILAGAIILSEAMQFFGFEEVVVSDRGLRYGTIAAKLWGGP